MPSPLTPIFFATPAEWRAWLEANHESATEIAVGFYKKGTGIPSMTWPQAVDEALCVGWIDGVTHRIDGERFQIRFTPRRARSIWSDVNVGRVAELTAQGRMTPAGIAAFEARSAARSGVYSFEEGNRNAALSAEQERLFKTKSAAWDWFSAQAPSYKRAAVWWVVSAKQEATRARRLSALIDHSADAVRLPQFRRTPNP
ncbi:MAG: YdeI/OmpD-associated family protein [Gemmatimonadota bacterium]